MQWNQLVWLFAFTALACTHTEPSRQQVQQRYDNVRLAQAEVATATGSPVKGTIQFEQMPNSMIVVHRIEGLAPKKTYQIFVDNSQDCRSANPKSAQLISQVRTNKNGIAENTFKTEDFTVSGARPVIGHTLIITDVSASPKSAPSAIACGSVQPFTKSASAD